MQQNVVHTNTAALAAFNIQRIIDAFFMYVPLRHGTAALDYAIHRCATRRVACVAHQLCCQT